MLKKPLPGAEEKYFKNRSGDPGRVQIQEAISEGQEIIVQVDKEEREADLRHLIVNDNPEQKYWGRCGGKDVSSDGNLTIDRSANCHWWAHLWYASLLAGADLPHVAAAFLERARTQGGNGGAWLAAGENVVELHVGPEAKVRLLKARLAKHPGQVGAIPARRDLAYGIHRVYCFSP